jgi:hypothetical protein
MSDETAQRLRLAAANMAERFYGLALAPITEDDVARLVEAAIRVGWDARESAEDLPAVAKRALREVERGR